jgi:hypothetical protein
MASPTHRPTSIKLPALDISPPNHSSASSKSRSKGRGRSGSLLKVELEKVGSSTVEDVLDQNTYMNNNANWVNAKG